MSDRKWAITRFQKTHASLKTINKFMFKKIPIFSLIPAIFAANGCGLALGTQRMPSGEVTPMQLSLESMANQAQSLTAAERQAAFGRVEALTWNEYYALERLALSRRDVDFDGVLFPAPARQLEALRPIIQALNDDFATLGDANRALGGRLTAPPPSEIVAGWNAVLGKARARALALAITPDKIDPNYTLPSFRPVPPKHMSGGLFGKQCPPKAYYPLKKDCMTPEFKKLVETNRLNTYDIANALNFYGKVSAIKENIGAIGLDGEPIDIHWKLQDTGSSVPDHQSVTIEGNTNYLFPFKFVVDSRAGQEDVADHLQDNYYADLPGWVEDFPRD